MENWILIFGMLAITFATRYSLFAFPDLRFPPVSYTHLTLPTTPYV